LKLFQVIFLHASAGSIFCRQISLIFIVFQKSAEETVDPRSQCGQVGSALIRVIGLNICWDPKAWKLLYLSYPHVLGQIGSPVDFPCFWIECQGYVVALKSSKQTLLRLTCQSLSRQKSNKTFDQNTCSILNYQSLKEPRD
jgi:hypothetical protein